MICSLVLVWCPAPLMAAETDPATEALEHCMGLLRVHSASSCCSASSGALAFASASFNKLVCCLYSRGSAVIASVKCVIVG